MNCSCSAVSIIDSHEVERFQEFLCDKNPSAVWRDIPIDSQTLTHLTIGNSSINSLHFLPSLTSLTYLNLSFNQINDISPIAGLISLKVLDISHNKICDLNPIQQMSELAILRFHYNFIETLDPIRELGQLVEVWASRNHLEIFELFNILLWKNLQHIFIEGNPLDAKPKYLEFIHALSPNLFSINGLPIHSIFPVSKGHPSDFFRTVDGRLMLTQARSRLTDSQKEFLLKYHTVPLKTANCSQFFEQSSTNVVGFQHNINHQPSVQETSNTQYNEKIRYFKAKKHTLPRKFVSSNVNIQEFRGAVEENFNVESAQTVARFGEGSNAPVALLLESDGKGYARFFLISQLNIFK